jgi:hypothetical protein
VSIDSPQNRKLLSIAKATSSLQQDVGIVLHADCCEVVSIRTTSVMYVFAPGFLAHENGVKNDYFKESCFENSWRKPH